MNILFLYLYWSGFAPFCVIAPDSDNLQHNNRRSAKRRLASFHVGIVTSGHLYYAYRLQLRLVVHGIRAGNVGLD